MGQKKGHLFDLNILLSSMKDAFLMLTPQKQIKNPVMFVTYLGAIFTTGYVLWESGGTSTWFNIQIILWLWITVLFANFAQSIAESRGKAQAASLKQTQIDTYARKIINGKEVRIPVSEIRKGDIIIVAAGEIIPADGDVIDGIATVDESAITGESAPVIRESGGDRCAVTAGTKVVSDQLKIQVISEPGNSFLDRMIHLIEGAKRQPTPNEIALHIVLSSLSIIFVLTTFSLKLFADYSGAQSHADLSSIITPPVLVSLLVCLIPTTISALLSAVGIAGMDRLIQCNVVAKSGRSVEASGDIDLLILDKTGTITMGNRQAVEFLPIEGIREKDFAQIAQLASLSDETPEGRSIVVLAKTKFNLRAEVLKESQLKFIPFSRAIQTTSPAVQTMSGEVIPSNETLRSPLKDAKIVVLAKAKFNLAELLKGTQMKFIPFSAQTRMSGVDVIDASGKVVRSIRKGSKNAIQAYVENLGGFYPQDLDQIAHDIAKSGGTPLLVCENQTIIGVVHLKDIIKGGIRERFEQMRKMGIKTVMVTGDNALTAAAIAAEAGVDDFEAEASPEKKLELIKRTQEGGRLVAMIGDGTNDAPALAQADVGVAMNTGTQASREAGNMVDLDSNPTKLLDIVEIGKQLLMTRGALTTFSIANDVAKYFAIIPALFGSLYVFDIAKEGPLSALNVMGLHSPQSAILSAVIFNALIIVALIPLALRGVTYHAQSAYDLLKKNILLYGVGGIVAPFIGIKLIDIILIGAGALP
jgi:potassium-transporting ATPase ATP-binding subunit